MNIVDLLSGKPEEQIEKEYQQTLYETDWYPDERSITGPFVAGTAIPATTNLPAGGKDGQYLAKKTDIPYEVEWRDLPEFPEIPEYPEIPEIPSYLLAISQQDIMSWNNKQEALMSGINIKTINGQSVLGEGDLNAGDTVPIDSIFEYEGDTVPDGFIEYTGEIGGGGTSLVETDPTVPAHVKAITLEDIAKWNSGTGSGGSGGNSSPEVETVYTPLLNYDFVTTGVDINKCVTIQKYGKLCILTVNFDGMYTLKSGEQRVIASIPEGYRPLMTQAGTIYFKKESYNGFYLAGAIVYKNGDIKIEQWSGSTYNVGKVLYCLTYITE